MYGKLIEPDKRTCDRKGERGAALLTVLCMSTLLLAVGGALIMVTTTATRTAVDSTAEMQAFYSAEAGVQQTLNVLRGNIAPKGAMPSNTHINFRKAVTPSDSNLPSDTTGVARLSGFLDYGYTPTGAANPDRVTLTSSYSPVNGLAYSVVVSDPDDTPVANGEPLRLMLRVTGYGPKGAVKRLDLVVKRSNFDYSPPATIMMRGSDDGTPLNFDIGASNAKDYSGHDHGSDGSVLPSFGATNDADRNIEINSDDKDTAADPKAATVANANLPSFLQSADKARAFVADQKANAISQGRYFTTFTGDSGSAGNPQFTFVDGDCSLTGGAGLLIVTGNLEMSGNPSFNGLILVLGGGGINRNGGGNGNIYGAIACASFGSTGGFGFSAASFHTNGGGNATIQYDSDAVRQALNMSGPRILGVAEY
jgi:hypothetical protein